MASTTANGITIEYETDGDPANPAMLLVMGLGAQLLAWPIELREALADAGFFVIVHDNRDVGLSTTFDDAGEPDLEGLLTGAATAPYTLSDMAADSVGLLDALGIGAAHVVGASMGGMIVQTIAIEHPDRVLSLCSIMSTTGNPEVGQATPEAMTALARPQPTSREEAIAAGVEMSRVIASTGFPFDEDAVRERVTAAHDRCFNPAGTTRQLAAILASGDRTAALADVDVPTLVIHGSADPLVTVSGGEATARAVPGAELLVIEGMGHDLPLEVVPRIADAIVTNARRAGS